MWIELGIGWRNRHPKSLLLTEKIVLLVYINEVTV